MWARLRVAAAHVLPEKSVVLLGRHLHFEHALQGRVINNDVRVLTLILCSRSRAMVHVHVTALAVTALAVNRTHVTTLAVNMLEGTTFKCMHCGGWGRTGDSSGPEGSCRYVYTAAPCRRDNVAPANNDRGLSEAEDEEHALQAVPGAVSSPNARAGVGQDLQARDSTRDSTMDSTGHDACDTCRHPCSFPLRELKSICVKEDGSKILAATEDRDRAPNGVVEVRVGLVKLAKNCSSIRPLRL